MIHLQGDFRLIEFRGTKVNVGAGAMMPTLAKQAGEVGGLTGVELLIGVPGTIGGGLVMNAGTREGVAGECCDGGSSAWGSSSRGKRLTAPACSSSVIVIRIWKGDGSLERSSTLKSDDPASIMKRIESLLQYRMRTQPLTTSNCGSVFKNPSEAARLHNGLKKPVLKAPRSAVLRVSERHANFIINEDQRHGELTCASSCDRFSKKYWKSLIFNWNRK